MLILYHVRMWHLVWLCVTIAQVIASSEIRAKQETLSVGKASGNFSHYDVLNYTATEPGRPVKPGTKLRILCAGDSITSGWKSEQDGGDGDGYRRQLQKDLSEDEVVFAGTVEGGTMTDGYFAAWPGKTIQVISDRIGPSLDQRPNIILLHAGTNDMNSRSRLTQAETPADAAERLGRLIDKMIKACPDAVILVAVIVGTCDTTKVAKTPEYQALIPGVVQERRQAGHHVLAVDFSTYPIQDLRDCVHPTNEGYRLFGDYWYDFVTQIPSSWIKEPVGDDPQRSVADGTRRISIHIHDGCMFPHDGVVSAA
ncbi:SGNH-hydro domain-containing protein [Fusarium keratoplasticum]|nr:SGNH-hydro domain-containing protein [Fusarium keratoplasticum]